MKISDLALYSKANLTLIPLNGKIPTQKDWVNAQYKDYSDTSRYPRQDEEVGINVGLRLDKTHLVIDVDPRNFKDFNSFDKLCEDIGVNIANESKVTVNTGSGGQHYYFTKPPLAIYKDMKAYPGVEFRSYGTQVVIPPSIHPDTKTRYEFQEGKGSLEEITPAPKPLLDLIVKKETALNLKGSKEFKDDPQDIERVKKILDTTPPAVEGEQGDNHTYAVCCIGRDHGLSPEAFLPLLQEWNAKNSPPWEFEDLVNKLNNAYSYAQNNIGAFTAESVFDQAPIEVLLSDEQAADQSREIVDWRNELAYNSNGDLKKVFKNLVNYLRHYDDFKGKLAFNEFNNSVVWLSPAPWHEDLNSWDAVQGVVLTDDDLLHLKGMFSKLQCEFSVNQCHEACRLVSLSNKFHPIRSWFSTLKWDGVNRLERWLHEYLGAPMNAYTAAVGIKTFVAMVARIYEPGCKFDYMLVLEGIQGIGKSTALRIIGGQYFTDAFIDMKSKDAALQIQGRMLVEIPELQSFTYVDMNTFKAFTSRQFDVQRNPYDRMVSQLPRQCVMVGTTNHTDYCKDETGNRRLWPVRVTGLNQDALIRDRDQLFAEALYRYNINEPLFLHDPVVEAMATEEQQIRHANDEWETDIRQWIEDGNIEACTGSEIWQNCFSRNVSTFDRKSQHRVARCMINLGFEKGVYRDGNHMRKGYKKVEKI